MRKETVKGARQAAERKEDLQEENEDDDARIRKNIEMEGSIGRYER